VFDAGTGRAYSLFIVPRPERRVAKMTVLARDALRGAAD